jgi:hypothetical protein
VPEDGAVLDAYFAALKSLATPRLVVVPQASGMGKTKLAVSLGLAKVPTVIIRVAAHEKAGLTPPWVAFKGTGSHKLSALYATLLSNVDWSITVLENLHGLLPSGLRAGEKLVLRRRALVLANRNGVADTQVASLAKQYMLQCDVILLDDRLLWEAWAAKLAMRWKEDCTRWGIVDGSEDAFLHVCVDEAQALLGVHHGTFPSTRSMPPNDAFHQLVGVLNELADTHGWLVSACGTHPNLVNIVERHSQFQSAEAKAKVVRVLTRLSTDQMLAHMQHHTNLPWPTRVAWKRCDCCWTDCKGGRRGTSSTRGTLSGRSLRRELLRAPLHRLMR